VLTEGNSKQCKDNKCRKFNPAARGGRGNIVDYHAYSDGREFYLAAGWSWTGKAFRAPGGFTFTFVDGQPKFHIVKEQVLNKAIGDCIHELYPMFEMTSFKTVNAPKDRRVNNDEFNGVVGIRGANGSTFDVVSDPTPPQYAVDLMKASNSRGLTANFGSPTGDTPFWTYACPVCDQSSGDTYGRPGEARYPELYRNTGMTYFRTQIHELGAALSLIRDKYYPPPPPLVNYERLDDHGLYKDGHGDDGPAMEDCIGRKYFNLNGLKPRS
jgi:hypothetical protein